MALRIRFQYQTGATLGYSIERMADGLIYDNATGSFSASPATPIAALPEGTGLFIGSYSVTLSPTPSAQFSDGDYAVRLHNGTANNVVIGLLPALMHGGDDATVFPGGSTADPWASPLPGNYAAGTAGAILGLNLDAKVSTRSTFAGGPVASVAAPVTVGTVNDKTGYSLSQAFPANFATLAIGAGGSVTAGTVSDKTGYSLSQPIPAASAIATAVASAMATSPVGSVAAPVTVGTVNDKTGYSLSQAFPANFANLTIATSGGITLGAYAQGLDPASLLLATPANRLATDGQGRVAVATVADKAGYTLGSSGLDSIVVEAGINARQALSPILAASAGVVTGAGTGTIVIRGANTSQARIAATTDNAGNRTSVTLSLPT